MKPLVISFLIFVFSVPCMAEFDAQGEAALYGSTMPGQNEPGVTQKDTGLEIHLKTQYKFSKSLRMQFSPWIKTDSSSQDKEDKLQYDPEELGLEYRHSSLKLKAGYTRINWEGTDFVNPMDIVSAKNYRDPFNSSSRSSAGIFYSDQLGKVSWDLVLIPKQTQSVLPGENSPWWPRHLILPIQTDDVILRLPDHVTYQIEDEDILNQAYDRNAGLRLQYHGDWGDISLAGFDGAAATPMLLPTVNVSSVEVSPRTVYQLNSPVLIKPVFYRQRAGAAAGTLTLGSWIFRLSAQHTQALGDDPRLPSWSQYGVFAIEKTFSVFEHDLTLIFQDIEAHHPASQDLSLLSSLYDHSYMFGWRWAFHDDWTWSTAFFQERKFYSSYLHSELGWSFHEHWRQDIAFDVLSGSADSPLGTYDKNDRATLRLNYLF